MGKRSDKKKIKIRKDKEKTIEKEKAEKAVKKHKAEQTKLKNEGNVLKKRKLTLFEKYHWIIIFSLYLFVLLVVLLFYKSNEAGLFLGFLSVGTAIFFSDYYRKKILYIKNHKTKQTAGKSNLLMNSLMMPIVSVMFSLIFAYVFMKLGISIRENSFDFPIITVGNIGDILTWSGLVLFAVDKTNIYKTNPYEF